MKNILLVDDHSIVRQGLKNLIELEEGLQVTGEAASGIEAIQLIRANSYDVVVLDLSMPDKNGVDGRGLLFCCCAHLCNRNSIVYLSWGHLRT